MSNCISFVSIARNVVTCEHVIKRNVILHRFFCVNYFGFYFYDTQSMSAPMVLDLLFLSILTDAII